MPIIRKDIIGGGDESSDERPEEKEHPERDDRDPRGIPDLRIVEDVPVPEKGSDFPPWRINEILEKINGNRKETEKELPN